MIYITMREIAPNFVIYATDLLSAIEKITREIRFTASTEQYIEQATTDIIDDAINPKPDWNHPELIGLWAVYLLLMFGSLIFRQWYLIWPILTFIFLKWRGNIVRK